MSAPVDPVVLGYRADPLDLLDRLVLFLPDDWMMVLLRPYSDDLRAQIRAENDADDLDYLVSFSQGGTDGSGSPTASTGSASARRRRRPFLQIEFELGLASSRSSTAPTTWGSRIPCNTYGLFDQLVNVLDPGRRGPCPGRAGGCCPGRPRSAPTSPRLVRVRDRRRAGLTSPHPGRAPGESRSCEPGGRLSVPLWPDEPPAALWRSGRPGAGRGSPAAWPTAPSTQTLRGLRGPPVGQAAAAASARSRAS
jgi:hypothetical protein